MEKKYIKLISLQKILTQMKNSVFKIKINEHTNTGFLCKIPFPDKDNLLKVLITFSNLSKEDIMKLNKIHISFDNEKTISEIYIDEKTKIYLNKKYNIAFIEIRKMNKIDDSLFLEIDENILLYDNQNKLKDMQVYLIAYPYQKEGVYSNGLIKDLKDDGYIIEHLCSSYMGCSGGPILNSNNMKVIGVHIGEAKNKKCNFGIFLKKPLEEFNELFK